MPIAPLPLTKQKNLTEVGHLGDHSHNQRRFALMLPHFIGIGAPLHRNMQVAMRCSIDPLPYVSPACNRQIPAGPWYESTETLFKIHIVTRSPQAPAAYFKRIFIRYWGLREAI